MHFFVSTDFLEWNVLRVDEEKIDCPVLFSEEFIAFLQMEISQSDSENDKNLVFQFSKILCIFC